MELYNKVFVCILLADLGTRFLFGLEANMVAMTVCAVIGASLSFMINEFRNAPIDEIA